MKNIEIWGYSELEQMRRQAQRRERATFAASALILSLLLLAGTAIIGALMFAMQMLQSLLYSIFPRFEPIADRVSISLLNLIS
jgi:hypothetical protein